MKYLKLLFLPLLFGCALAQQTPINNPVFTGNVTFTSTPSVTNNMVYVDNSNRLQSLTLGTGLSLSGGILTVTGNGGGGGGAGVFTTLQVGTDTPTTAQPIDFTPVVIASSSSAKELRISGTLTNVANNDALYGIASGGIITANSAYTNVSFTHLLLGTTSTTGSISLANATELYINAAPQTGGTATYGIVQAGTNDSNTFSGPTTFYSNVSINGFSYLNGISYLPLATFVGSGSSPAITFGDTSTLTTSGFTFNKLAQFNASSGYVANFSGPTYFNSNQYYNTSLFIATNGGPLVVNGATGQVLTATLQGLTWNGTNTLTATVGTTGVSVNTTLASVPIGNYASVGEVIVSWNRQVFSDNSSFWSSGDPTKIYVPYGVTRVRVSACINWQDVSGGNREVKIKDNLGNVYGANVVPADATFPSNYCSTTSGIIDISSMGNPSYFQVIVAQDSGSTINILAASSSYFTMQVIK